ncbi:MAG: EAL domain-containing protein [Ilumatobacteraceae bacterium]
MNRVRDVSSAFELVEVAARVVLEADDLDDALQRALDTVCRIQGWSAGRAWRTGATDIDVLVATGLSSGPSSAEPWPVPSPLALRALHDREPRLRPPNSRPGADQMTSPVVLAAPVVVGDEVRYVLEFEGDRSITSDDLATAALQSVCAGVAHRIEDAGRTGLQEAMRWRDPLTGLSTRSVVLAQAQRALAVAGPTNSSIAIFSLGLDDFRFVNELHGPDRGDQVLVAVADRLRVSLRQHDTVARSASAISRVGGDEFLLMCERVHGDAAALVIATRLLEAVAAPIELDTGHVMLTATIGIAVSAGESEPQQMVLDAEAAQRHAKELGGARYQLFAAQHRQRAAPASALVEALHHALSAAELRLVYQPKISLATNRIVGVEALLRWDHPTGGVIMPDEFIPAAERSGVIVPIGAWVLRESSRQAAAWYNAYPKTRPQVAVNVSARQFRTGLARTIREAVDEAGISSSALCLEMTETTIMDDIEYTVEILDELRGLGFTVSIDDFGTGYSSLEYLHRLAIDEVKIDRSFVAGLGVDDTNTAIVASVISLAHAMNLEVVAEGVETLDQLDRLRSLGCDLAQGYFIARPVTPVEIDDYLAADTAGLELPLADPTGGSVRPSVAESVLVVDDAADVRMLAMMSLTAAGFTVEEAGNGASALALARRLVPDCVLLDVSMPDMSGIEVCRALRNDPETAGCTIVMLTSQANSADKAEAFLVGADDYIVKPFTPRDLVTRVRSAVRRRQSSIGTIDRPVDGALLQMFKSVRERKLSEDVLSDAERLSTRQIEILERLLGGERVPAIARDLYVSQSTVRNHLSAIYQRVGVHSQEELLSLLRKQGGRLFEAG